LIQYYPGHMAAAMRKLAERVRLIDVIVEVIDARIPAAGSNTALEQMSPSTPRLIVLTRADLADAESTQRWLSWYESERRAALALDARRRGSFSALKREMTRLAGEARLARAMVVGIPNAGKSTVINGLVGRSAARVENRAGVTRAPQWFRLSRGLEVMDTPGILVPKIESPEAGWHLAACGALPRARFDPEEVVGQLTAARPDLPRLERFAEGRRIVRARGEPDLHNAALAFLREFDEGRFGRISLEEPPASGGGQ